MNYDMPKVDKTILIRNTFKFLSEHDLSLTIRVNTCDMSQVTVTMDRNNTHVKVYTTVQEYVEMLNDVMSFRRMLFDMYGKICQEERMHENTCRNSIYNSWTVPADDSEVYK